MLLHFNSTGTCCCPMCVVVVDMLVLLQGVVMKVSGAGEGRGWNN